MRVEATGNGPDTILLNFIRFHRSTKPALFYMQVIFYPSKGLNGNGAFSRPYVSFFGDSQRRLDRPGFGLGSAMYY